MWFTMQRLKQAAAAGVLCACAHALTGGAQAADSVVPSSWNVAPLTAGASREAFDASLPAWAGTVGVSVVTNEFPSMAGSSLPSRTNAWFGANSKVLLLDTEGAVVTNTVAYPGAEGAVSYASKPVYVDMRVHFDAMSDGPYQETIEGTKMAIFLSSDAKLVAVHAGGWTTNATTLDTNRWYQVTIKMLNGKFDVLMNDSVVFSDLSLMNTAGNTLAAASFSGTGLIDELYISHGNPAYAVAGPTGAIPTLPAAGANPPTDEQQTRINAWLDGLAGIDEYTVLNMTQDQLSLSYLLDELGGDSTTAQPASVAEFGISAIDLVSTVEVVVTARLETGSGLKEGAVNGKIQLQGKVAVGDGWTTLGGAITPSYADFTAGLATYTFSIPAGGYQFFRAQIVP
jgi:hypothetical protein